MVAQTYQTASRHLLAQAHEETRCRRYPPGIRKRLGRRRPNRQIRSRAARMGTSGAMPPSVIVVIRRLVGRNRRRGHTESCSTLPMQSPRELSTRTGTLPKMWPVDLVSTWNDSWTSWNPWPRRKEENYGSANLPDRQPPSAGAGACEELAAGDTRQASEKGWGAAAQMVKSVAAQTRLGASREPCRPL